MKKKEELPADWKAAFQGSAMRSSFCLALTQPMLEFLCATADGINWDRRLYCRGWGNAKPDSWLVSGQALIKRGLITRLSRDDIGKMQHEMKFEEMVLVSLYRLTPAGEAVVALLKVAGIFIEADAALERGKK